MGELPGPRIRMSSLGEKAGERIRTADVQLGKRLTRPPKKIEHLHRQLIGVAPAWSDQPDMELSQNSTHTFSTSTLLLCVVRSCELELRD